MSQPYAWYKGDFGGCFVCVAALCIMWIVTFLLIGFSMWLLSLLLKVFS